MFLSKFDGYGYFEWAETWGGSLDENGHGVAIDTSAYVYVTGDFDSSDAIIGTTPLINKGGIDAFVAKFDSFGIPGTRFEWAQAWGGPGNEYADEVACDHNKSVYVTGAFDHEVDFNPDLLDVDLHDPVGSFNAYLLKFLENGWWEMD